MIRLRDAGILALSVVAAGCSSPGGNPIDAAVMVSPVNGPTSETGGQASFSLSLAAKPKSEVVFQVASGDLTEGTVSPSSVTFTSENFAAPQVILVTGQDDDVADGASSYAITISAPLTQDGRYVLLDPADVVVVNVDDETAGVSVSPISGATTEGGGQASFAIALASQPTADVAIPVSSSNILEGTVPMQSVTFTPANWSAPQIVTITGINDPDDDGSQTYQIVFGAVTSADPGYAGLSVAALPVTNIDDDSAGILVSPSASTTTEGGSTATISIALASRPSANVTVNFNTSDATEGLPSVTSRTFTTTNYAAPQSVIVTGQNDSLADGNQTYSIAFSATTSADTTYSAMIPPSVLLTNTDNDSAGITVSPVSGGTAENGGIATFSIVLTSQPTASVTVNFNTSDATEGTPAVTSRTFSTSNFATRKA